MSNGGYKGNTPARETSPEQYPGVWELTEQFQAQADGNWPFQETDCAPKSLRFNSADSSYLSKTFASAGNRKLWTWSCWAKRSAVNNTSQLLFYVEPTVSSYLSIGWSGDNFQLNIAYNGTTSAYIRASAKTRDPSAWAHYMAVYDSANATSTDRIIIYINGERVTDFVFSAYPNQNALSPPIHTTTNYIGTRKNVNQYFDGYLADVHFINGQALTPDAFTYIDGQGVLQPKRFTGDYSSGPVYSNQTSVTGTTGSSDASNAFDGSTSTYTSIGSGDNTGTSTLTFTPSSPIAVSIGVRVYMQIDRGQSISVNGSQTNASVSAGWNDTGFTGTLTSLAIGPTNSGSSSNISAIEIDGVILTDATVGRNSFHLDFLDGAKDQSGLGNNWTLNNINAVAPTASYSSAQGSNITSAEAAKVFDTDDSDYGVATGDLIGFAYSGNSVEMKIQNTDTTQTNLAFYIQPYVSGGATNSGSWSSPSVGTVSSNVWNIPANSTGTATFTFPSGYDGVGRLYLSGWSSAFRMYSMKAGASETDDLLVDSPVNGNQTDSSGLGGIVQGNYATLNPLDANSQASFANGNLDWTATNGNGVCRSTIAVSSGKWYFEFTYNQKPSGGGTGFGILSVSEVRDFLGAANAPDGYSYYSEGSSFTRKYNNGSNSNYGASFAPGDVIGVALDLDGGTITFYKNGASQGQAFSGISGTYAAGLMCGTGVGTARASFNAGQRAFKYPLAGYKSLCTSNLPEPSIPIPSQYFDTKLWTGNGSSQIVSGLSFSPGLVWIKGRSLVADHYLVDQLRGSTPNYPFIASNQTYGEVDSSINLTAFNVNGFNLGAGARTNGNNQNYVGWNWDAGDSTTTIAAGSLNSSLYDQSQTWSGLWTGTADFGSFAAMHNATVSTANYMQSHNGATFTLPSALPVTSLRIYCNVYGTGGTLTVNGTDVTSQLQSSGAAYANITGFTSLSTINVTGTDGNNLIGLYAIELNGKLLIDSGLSVTNVPSIASTVRSSPESGFSICAYTGTGANATIGHGLNGKKPEFIIVKGRTNVDNWAVQHVSLGSTDRIRLSTNGTTSALSGYWNDTDPTSSVINVGGDGATNGNGVDYISYLFSSVEGYSSVGSYIGNGSNDGPFVYTGHSVAWVIIKRSDAVDNWVIYDVARDTYNIGGRRLHPDLNYAESQNTSHYIDILSNGFKVRSTGAMMNTSGGNYLYMSFASHPFKNSRAR